MRKIEKVYVASSFKNKDKVREMLAILRAAGFEITYDWTYCVDPPTDHTYFADSQRAGAETDILAVKLADVLVLEPHPEMRGGYVECGVALAEHKHIVCVGERPPTCFFHLRNVHVVATQADVPGFLKTLETMA